MFGATGGGGGGIFGVLVVRARTILIRNSFGVRQQQRLKTRDAHRFFQYHEIG